MRLSLFDLHCDTPYLLHKTRQTLDSNNLAISLQRANAFEQYTQVMAFWTDRTLTDSEGWAVFLEMYQSLLADPAVCEGRAQITTVYQSPTPAQPRFFLSVEDARIIEDRIDRIDILYHMGVRILTPLWVGDSVIGGAHDTQNGLTPFGKAALARALELGFLLDISHASERSAKEIAELSQSYHRPMLATHSNAYALCPVSRNLRDDQAASVISSDGLIGINLYSKFITDHKTATVDDLLLHIDRFLSLGAQDHLALGGDMDGCDLLPEIQNLSELTRLAERMLQKNYSEALVKKIFFENAELFAKKYLKL